MAKLKYNGTYLTFVGVYSEMATAIPEDYLWDNKRVRFYSKEKNTVYLGGQYSDYEKYTQKFKDEYLDWQKMPADLETIITKAIDKNEKRKEAETKKRQGNKAFEESVTGSLNIKEVSILYDYLEGKEEGGTQSLTIMGDYIKDCSMPILVRVGKDEYVMSGSLSGTVRSQSTTAVMVASALLTLPHLTLWPSTLHWKDYKQVAAGILPLGSLVFGWCLQRMKYAQLKRPTAIKYKGSYDIIQRQTVTMYKKARARWPDQLSAAMMEEIEELIAVYGDIKAMKDYNAALRMEHEFTK